MHEQKDKRNSIENNYFKYDFVYRRKLTAALGQRESISRFKLSTSEVSVSVLLLD